MAKGTHNKNIATISGRVNFGIAVGRLVQLTEALSQKQYNIHLAVRVLHHKLINDQMRMLRNSADSLEFIYDSKFLQTEYSQETILKTEKWLDVPFNLLISFDRRNKREIQKSKKNLKETYNFMTGYIEYLKDFFLRHDIHFFIGYKDDTLFNTIPIFVAQKMSISRLLINESRFPEPGTLFCRNDFSNMYLWNKDHAVNWEDIISQYENVSFKLEEKVKDKIFVKIPNIKRIYDYYSSRKKQIKISKYEKYTIPNNLSFHYNNAMFIVPPLREVINKAFFKRPDLSEAYFFMPLNYKEDAQITLREPFIDQFDLISAVSQTLPVGVKLYVKSHPHFKGSDVRIKDLLHISRMKNIKIIKPSAPVYELIKNSLGIITVNSTSGFEALMFDKPVIAAGHDTYCREDLCYVLRDINRLPQYIMNILNGQGPPSDFSHLQEFVKTVYKNTFFASKSYMWEGPRGEQSYFSEEKAKEFARIIDKIVNMEIEGNPRTIGSHESLFGLNHPD